MFRNAFSRSLSRKFYLYTVEVASRASVCSKMAGSFLVGAARRPCVADKVSAALCMYGRAA